MAGDGRRHVGGHETQERLRETLLSVFLKDEGDHWRVFFFKREGHWRGFWV